MIEKIQNFLNLPTIYIWPNLTIRIVENSYTKRQYLFITFAQNYFNFAFNTI